MRNANEQMLKEMLGKIFHVKVINVYPASEDWVDIGIEFLEGSLEGEHLTIEYRPEKEEE
jgi:2-phospho-L-lactate transferase/gluconeogenesis factor (CofD/UPF0052 family)